MTLAGGAIGKIQMKKAPEGARFHCGLGSQPPQLRTGPQSIWTKFEREYLPTPPAEQAAAALAICPTERDCRRRSAAWPFMCSEFFATPRDFERSIALVRGDR